MRYIGVIVIVFCIGITRVDAASMSVTVAQQTVAKGDTFVVEWYLNTGADAINVVDATLYYSADMLEVDHMNTGTSAASLWIQQPTVVEPGVIHLIGGIPGGVRGLHVPVMRTIFRATNVGTASIAIGKDSQVAFNDGKATLGALTMNPIAFPVTDQTSAVVYSQTHPNQNEWYKNNRVVFTIREKNPVVYSFSTNPETVPTGTPAVYTQPIVYKDLEDGMYYFKVAAPVGSTFQELQTYRVLIDRTAPVFHAVDITSVESVFGGAPTLNVYAVDKQSGVSSVSVRTGLFGLYHTVVTPYRLHTPLLGTRIRVRVTDMAGNQTTTTRYMHGYIPDAVGYPVVGVVLILFGFGIFQKREILRRGVQTIRDVISSK